jgi:hypothetical protein
MEAVGFSLTVLVVIGLGTLEEWGSDAGVQLAGTAQSLVPQDLILE